MDYSFSNLRTSGSKARKRSIWFHLHFWIGWIAALPIALVCLSGGILVFEESIFRWEHKALFQLEESGTPLSIEEVLDTYRSASPALVVNHLTIPESPRHSYSAYATEVRPEGNRAVRVFLNPYTGQLSQLGEEFSISETLIDVHRRLIGGRTGQLIVATSSLVLVFTCLFGLILWLPLRGRTFVRAWKRGQALDWHNALGLVALLPLMVMAITGVTFTWGQAIWPRLENLQGYPSEAAMPSIAVAEGDAKISMDLVVDRVRAKLPDQRITGIEPGNGQQSPIRMFLDADGNNLQLVMDPYTGEELLRLDGSGTGPVGWLRSNFANFHTFSPYNLLLRILWALLSAGGTVLVVTGLWVSAKRWLRPKNATRHGVAALAMLVISAAAGAQQPTVARTPEANALERRVDSLFTSQIRPGDPGCAVGIYRKGEMVLGRGYGLASIEAGRPITPRTTFALGSVSKPFTALAVLMLEQQGRLSLDDDVRRWVPELPDYGRPIHIRDLVQHTSGLRDYSALGTLSGRSVTTMTDFLGLLASQRALNFTPGTKHEYSHSDYVLLGLVVERVAGKPFGEHLEREVLRPMGMKESFVNDGRPRSATDRAFGHFVSTGSARIQFPGSQIVGGGNLYASVEDLARWDRNFDEPAVGGRAVMTRMLGRPQLANGDTIPYAYGLRLGTYRGLRTIARGGHTGGTRTEIIRFPDQTFTVATLCNADRLEAGKLAQGVADIYLGDRMRPVPPRPAPPKAVTASPAEAARYVGVYASSDEPWNLLPIEVRNGQLGEVLFHDATDDTLFALTPAGDGRFFEIGLTGNVGIFTFRSAAPGGPLRLEISWNGGPAETLQRVADSALWRPNPAALTEYTGTWFSDELDAGWRFDINNERLVLRRSGHHDLSLRPVERDQFVRGFGPWENEFTAHLRFHRDEAGKLTHLTVSTPPGEDSARDVRFVRVGQH